jgi:3-methyl-2-oxobutanoate hydroxymethyltransferase
LLDEGGADILLVGDSLGMVVQGLPNTLAVTLDEMIYHCRAVSRGAKRAQVCVDLPFLSYQVSPERALEAAGRLVKEGGAEAVKLEGGVRSAAAIEKIVEAGIPVMGHVGLTPQSVHAMGGFRVQGREEMTRRRLLEDAQAVERAGAYACVVEGVPGDLGEELSRALGIPTIGIGAGAGCDGQVLVCYDLLGLFGALTPKFVKRYAELGKSVVSATETFAHEVREGIFPAAEHTFAATPRRPIAAENTGTVPVVSPSPSYGPAEVTDPRPPEEKSLRSKAEPKRVQRQRSSSRAKTPPPSAKRGRK